MRSPFQQSKVFFFEKKNQKTFGPEPMALKPTRSKLPKVFCFFFSKKKFFLP